jgi:hypothetical protein
MVLRHIWLMAIAACATGQVFAQQAGPAEPAVTAARPAPPPAESTTVSADATQPAAAPAAANEASNAPAEAKLDADTILAAQKAGYKIKNEDGQTLLCRKDQQTGSRVRYTTSCLTAQEWRRLQDSNAHALKIIERTPRAAGN